MKFTVQWTNEAADELAAVWMSSSDRNAISAASFAIEQLLVQNPEDQGEVRFDTVRTLIVPPLGVDFEVVEADLRVWVLTTWDVAAPSP